VRSGTVSQTIDHSMEPEVGASSDICAIPIFVPMDDLSAVSNTFKWQVGNEVDSNHATHLFSSMAIINLTALFESVSMNSTTGAGSALTSTMAEVQSIARHAVATTGNQLIIGQIRRDVVTNVSSVNLRLQEDNTTTFPTGVETGSLGWGSHDALDEIADHIIGVISLTAGGGDQTDGDYLIDMDAADFRQTDAVPSFRRLVAFSFEAAAAGDTSDVEFAATVTQPMPMIPPVGVVGY